MNEDDIKKRFENAETVDRPEPLPLHPKFAPPGHYPVKALGKTLANAVHAIADLVQCPVAIAAQSVLATAALAAQAHADVVHPATKDRRPLSLFLVTVAASGERKSSADGRAMVPVRQREAELHEEYERQARTFRDASDAHQREREAILRRCKGNRREAEKQLAAMAPPPTAPLIPLLTAPDPTLEGLHKLMSAGEPSMGLFTDEGGGFLGGYGMSDESRLRTGAGLSSFWDCSPVKRVRGGDGVSILRHRRLSMHVLVQPGIAERLLADPTLQQQGLPSRLPVSAPASVAGTRMQKQLKASTEASLEKYDRLLLRLLKMKQPRVGIANPELNPRQIQLSGEARKLWAACADECERELAPAQRLEPVRAFANKLPEHALRIAGVLTIIESPAAEEISADTLARGVTLAR